VNLERYRKDAKALVRAHRASADDARARARIVLGERASERFQLSDAQHVVAVENGYRDWAELKSSAPTLLTTALEYLPGDPVTLRITHRRLVGVSDQGAAVERAGKPPGWRTVADRLADELVVNVSRSGTVGLPVSRCGPGFDAIVERVAHASLALYEELLELENR
jgi:hypothetical protein